MKKSNIFGLISLLLIIVTAYFAWDQRYTIYDYARLYNYQPTAEIAQLSENSGMNSVGQRIFYVNDPKVADNSTFNQKCPQKEQSIVLGCYNGREIFIYNVTESQLAGIKEVTAAHEMLHAAYDRLSGKEKQTVDKMLLESYQSIQDQRIKKIVETYRQEDPTIVNNELHSILATEIRNLPPPLEQYYEKYFADRKKVVDLSEQYESVFIDAKNQADQLFGDLILRKAEIERKEQEVSNLNLVIAKEKQNLINAETSGDINSYNSIVPTYNSYVNEYNNLLNNIKKLIDEYNSMVAKYNNIAGQNQELINSIDSKYQQL